MNIKYILLASVLFTGVLTGCNNDFLDEIPRDELSDADMVNRVDKLIAYWEEEDTKTKFMNRYTDGIINSVYSSDIMFDAP